jgi:hypothetical protein
MNNNSNPNTKCINCQHLVLDEKVEEYFCQKFSPHNISKKDKTWVKWPEKQSCGTEDVGYGTGKFLSKKSYNRELKLNQLGI